MGSNNNRTIGEALTDALVKKALALFDEKPAAEKKPSNAGLYLAWLGFNFIYLILDIGTSWMVGSLTNPYYAILTFVAGIGPFAVYEILFMRAWNKDLQKRLAIGGAAISLLSTVALAVIVGLINAIKYFQITTLPPWVSVALDVILILGLVAAASIHGLIWIVYFFADEGIVRKQTHAQNMAKRQQKEDDFAMAQDDVRGMIEIAKIVDQYEKANQLPLLSRALEQLTGQRLDFSAMKVNASTTEQPKLDPTPAPRPDGQKP